MDVTAAPAEAIPMVQCCVCGLVVESNPSNMCPNCIKSTVDISEGLIKEYILVHCPECLRYLQPPKYWTKAELESRELLTICIKKVRGLSKYHLVDASFLWTEPHSKRLKVKLVLQREIFANTVIQQAVQIDYVVSWTQCELCAKAATGQPQWDAVCQLRQTAEHRRTFFFLEQIILKHRMHDNVINIEGHPDGLDFYFSHRSHALQFVNFIGAHSPTARRDAVQLVSHDSKCNTAVQHYTFSIDISPICREDLVCLPKKLSMEKGGAGPLVIAYKIFSSIVFIDPQTLRAHEIQSSLYWKKFNGFTSMASTRQLVTFFVLNTRPTGLSNGRFRQAEVEVCLEDEVGGDREWIVLSHLGAHLKPGDLVKGYLVDSLNSNSGPTDDYDDRSLFPDVVLVRKHFPNQAARRHKRTWKMRRLNIEVKTANNNKVTQEQEARDYDEFLDEVERDPEYRAELQLYHDEQVKKPTPDPVDADAAAAEGEDEEDEVMVGVEELLDELQIAAAGAGAGDEEDDVADEGAEEGAAKNDEDDDGSRRKRGRE